MNAPARAPNVAVIGGGWAGCAAACTLAEAGIATTLFEASRTLGGRARGVLAILYQGDYGPQAVGGGVVRVER